VNITFGKALHFSRQLAVTQALRTLNHRRDRFAAAQLMSDSWSFELKRRGLKQTASNHRRRMEEETYGSILPFGCC